MKKFSKRRKIVESIPSETFYCYKPDVEKNEEENKKGNYKYYYTKSCKYYKHKKGLIGKCKLFKCEVIDQVKSCGLRE